MLDEAPVWTIGSEGEASGVVGEVAGYCGLGAVQDGSVMGLNELMDEVWEGGDDVEGGA